MGLGYGSCLDAWENDGKPDRIEFIQGLFSELDEGGDCSQIREDLSCQIQLWRQQASEDSYPPI